MATKEDAKASFVTVALRSVFKSPLFWVAFVFYGMAVILAMNFCPPFLGVLAALVVIPFANTLRLVFASFRYRFVTKPRKPAGLTEMEDSSVFGQFRPGGVEDMLPKMGYGSKPVWMGGFFDGSACFAVTHAEGIKTVLLKTDVFPKHPVAYDNLGPLLGKGLATSDGELWARQRRLLTPLFHLKQLRSYIPLLCAEGQHLVDELGQSGDEGVLCAEVFGHAALRLIMRAVFADRLDEEKMLRLWREVTDTLMIYALATSFAAPWVLQLMSNAFGPAMGPVHTFLDGLKQIRTDLCTVVEDAREGDAGGADLVGQMAQLKTPDGDFAISTDQIVDEAQTFCFAGQDTTSVTLSWCAFFLASNPAVADQLLDEYREVVGDKKELDEDMIKNLKLHNGAIREALRLRPPVPHLDRLATEDIDIGGVTIPKGSCVMAFLITAQRDPDVYEDPLAFKPERWVGTQERDAFSWTPFSAGARNCVGQKFALQEATAFLAMVNAAYRIESISDLNEVRGHYVGTWAPHDFRAKFIRREG